MGFINKIKKMFSKNIDCSEELEGRILYLCTNRNRVVNVGANIIVPEGFIAVFVCKDKVTDVILPGKYAINGANLPNTFSRMKLGKANKKGKYKKKFSADIYYISSDINTNIKFVAYNTFKIKSQSVGKIKATSEGVFNFQVSDAGMLLKYFLSERSVVDEKLFLDMLGGLVGNYVNAKISENKEDIITQLADVDQYLNNRINDQVELDNYFNNYGVRITKVKVDVLHTNSKKDLLELIEKEKANNKNDDFNFDFNVPIMVERNSNEEAKVCRQCGHQLNNGALFCEKCGRRINNLN